MGRRYSWVYCFMAPVAGVLLFLAVALLPFFPSYPIEVLELGRFQISALPWLMYIYPLIAMLPLVAALYLRRRCNAGLATSLLPLTLLPLAHLGYCFPCLPPIFSDNLLFFMPVVLVALTLGRLFAMDGKFRFEGRSAWIGMFVGCWMLFTLTGFFISKNVGETSVDEAHYLMQADSLYHDHDLNIINNLGFDYHDMLKAELQHMTDDPAEMEKLRPAALQRVRARLHVSNNSPEGKWYSWHPSGLPLLVAPFCGMGMFGRNLALGLIAAFGVLLMALLGIELGASRKWAVISAVLFALSGFWMVYSVRILPEVTGAVLVLGAVYATYIFHRHHLAGTVMLLLCVGFSPWAHPRFVPATALAAAFFLYNFFFVYDTSRKLKISMLVTMALCGVAAVLYLVFARKTFGSISSYGLHNLFWVYPEGGWLIFFSERGLIYGFPLAALLLVLILRGALFDREIRVYSIFVIVSLLVYALLFGTCDCWDGGPTYKGRYLMTVVPLLVPVFARWMSRCSTIERGWALFLAVWSAAYFFLPLAGINFVGREFLHDPVFAIKWKMVHLRHLLQPYLLTDIMIGHPLHSAKAFVANIFPLAFMLVSMILMLPAGKLFKTVTVTVLFPLSALAFHYQNFHIPEFLSANEVATALSHMPLKHARVYSCGGGQINRLQLWLDRFDAYRPMALSTRDLGVYKTDEDVYSRNRLDANGWENRGYRWLTLIAPFRDGFAGRRRLTLSGSIKGNATGFVAVREGGNTLLYEPLPVGSNGLFRHSFELNLKRDFRVVYILLRAEGDGQIDIHDIDWTPVLPVTKEGE